MVMYLLRDNSSFASKLILRSITKKNFFCIELKGITQLIIPVKCIIITYGANKDARAPSGMRSALNITCAESAVSVALTARVSYLLTARLRNSF